MADLIPSINCLNDWIYYNLYFYFLIYFNFHDSSIGTEQIVIRLLYNERSRAKTQLIREVYQCSEYDFFTVIL